MITSNIVPSSTVFINNRMEGEYYTSEALVYLKKKVKWIKIGSILDFVQYGTSLALNEEGLGHKIFRLNEIEDCFLTKPEKWVLLNKRQYISLRLEKSDILVCRTNGNVKYVGRAGMPREDIDAVFASYLVRVKTNANYVLPEYLAIYLNTKVGRAFIERQAMQSNQFNLSAEQLGKIPIPLFDKKFQNQIKKTVADAVIYINLSYSSYSQAENLLLTELGLQNFKAKDKLFYNVNLFETSAVHRIDAEYFQPSHEEIIKKIKNHENGYGKLLSFADNVKPKFEPQKYPQKTFSYVELADINSSIGVIQNSTNFTGEEAPSRARRILKKNDVIVSSVEGSLEKVALVDEQFENSLASTGFFQFRPKNIFAEVLLILSKSPVIQTQLKKECAGTILTAVPKEAIRRLIIPDFSKNIQRKIASLVQQSHEARKKAKELLEKAKKEVENAIEKEQKK